MEKKYVYENYNQVFKNVEQSIGALSNVSSRRELWNILGQILPKEICATILFFRPISYFDDQSGASKIQLFQGGINAFGTELVISKKDALTLTKNIDSSKSVQLGPVNFYSSLLLRDVENQRLKEVISDDLGETYVSQHYGANGSAGFTIFKLKSDSAVDTNLANVILTSFFQAVHSKCSSLEFDEIIRRLRITPREVDVLKLLTAGKSNAEIAADLKISIHTIGSYVGILSLKLNSKNRTVTALRAITLGLTKA